MSHEEAVFETGDIVADRYEIVEELGRGSYGVVYRAVQLGIGRDVAVKTLLPDTEVGSEEQKRFEREAMLISRLNHPNIVTLFDYGEHQGVLFMAMEFVDGRNLKDVIEAEAPLAPERVRALIYQMLDALQFAHDHGVVHRDLKPENIQLLRNPSMEAEEAEALKVLDFGIAKVVHGSADGSPLNSLTQTGVAMGTPQYMSPENITGDPVTHHADLYAVGLLLYEMLTGEPAFSAAGPREVMVAHIRDDAPTLPDDPGMRPFDRGLAKALEKQPDDRVQSARQLRTIFEEDAPVRPTATAAQPAAVEQGGGALSVPLVATVAAASIVLFLMVLLVLQGDDAEEPVVQQVVIVEESAQSDGGGQPDEGSGEVPMEELAEEEPSEEELHEDPSDQEPEAEEVLEAVATDPPVEESPRSARAQPRPSREEEPEPPAQEVELEIVTDPAAARVSVDGRPVGMSPLTHTVTRGDGELEIGFSLMGYNDTVHTVVPDRSQTVKVKLERGRLQLD